MRRKRLLRSRAPLEKTPRPYESAGKQPARRMPSRPTFETWYRILGWVDNMKQPIARLSFLACAVFGLQAQTMTAPDIAAFLDGLVPLQLKREDIAGAVIIVVKDGQVLFAQGYGYADVEKKTPVSPDATLFRPGSISKLFTWTAVMQLVEREKLNLDHDVNEYLDFKIPPTYPKPITLRNIMTHTSGFEETAKELFLADVKDLKPLGDYLKARLPQRIFPPGTTPAYSNYATALAGYIVQRVSGEPYDDYIENHILKPLGMTHTTFRQPLPDPLKPLMSNGYQVASKPAKPFEVVQAWPAGSSSTTASDMARFMIAHLQDGQLEGAQILRPDTARLMHSRQFENLPQLNAMALGFYEETRNGHRIIGHGGDTVYFHSDLHLMQDSALGFFISQNSGGRAQISFRSAVWEGFLDRYFPYTPPPAAVVASAKDDSHAVSGDYISSRRSATTILSVSAVAGEASLHPNSDGTISSAALKGLNGEPKRFREIAPLVFRDVDGQSLIGFKRDDSGRMILAIDFPFMVFQRASWFEGRGFNAFVIGGALVVFALTIVLWPVGALVRRHYGRELGLDAGQRRLRRLIRIVCAVDLAFALAWVGLLTSLTNPGRLNETLDPVLRLIQLIGWVGAAGALLALYGALTSLVDEKRWWFSKLHDAGIALACVGFVWFIFHWNMLHWSLNY